MTLTELESLLLNIKTLPVPSQQEANIFSVGARGHYENPVSDILAFFLDAEGGHGLGSLVLEALLSCLPQGGDMSTSLVSQPQREIWTSEGNRIDLLLETDCWVMVIENKIWHKQNNPFEDYVAYLHGSFSNKTPCCVVLSPTGRAPANWTGISYRALTRQLASRLGEAFVTTPFNKWLILLREYVLHLESLMENPALPAETEAFVLENLHRIHEMVQLKNSVITAMMEEGKRMLASYFSQQDYEVKVVQHTWVGYPALRFKLNHWVTQSDVVLYLHGEPDEQYEIRTYACELTSEALREKAVATLCVQGSEEYWDEKRGTIIGFVVYQPQTTAKSALFAEVAKRMTLLDRFEREGR